MTALRESREGEAPALPRSGSGGVLLDAISPDREAVYQKAIEMRPGHFAIRFLGEPPEDLAFLR